MRNALTLTIGAIASLAAGCGDHRAPPNEASDAAPPAPTAPSAPRRDPAAPISDAELIAADQRPFSPADRARMMGRREVLGTRNGVPVVVDYPCSDLCPAYTTRILHLDVEPGPACRRARGVVREVGVPAGDAIETRGFCVPPVLVDRNAGNGPPSEH